MLGYESVTLARTTPLTEPFVSPGDPPHAIRAKNLRRPIAHRLRRGNGCRHGAAGAAPWLPATPEKLPRWRGFNLLEKFLLTGGRKPFLEEDFRLISKLGFNFVRLPMDYRCWIKDGNWEEFDEATLREIDQAVAWGGEVRDSRLDQLPPRPRLYGRPARRRGPASGPTPRRRRVCAEHWAMFARRYRGIPSERLSFNLMNEPGQVEPKAYVAVVRKLVEAIRGEDPDRLIIADGLQWGTVPVPELRETPHRPGHARLHAHGNQPLQGKLGQRRVISPIRNGRACCRPTARCSVRRSPRARIRW